MNLNYQTVMRSCYKLGKTLPNGRWEQTSPEGRRIWKAKLSERGTKCREEKESLYYMLVVFIRPQSLPSAVSRSIDGFHADVIRLQSQKSEVLGILIYTRLKINRK